jgi:hypothetical protein
MATATMKWVLPGDARQAIGERLQRIATNANDIRRTLMEGADMWEADELAEGIETIAWLLGEEIGVAITTPDPYSESEDDDDRLF